MVKRKSTRENSSAGVSGDLFEDPQVKPNENEVAENQEVEEGQPDGEEKIQEPPKAGDKVVIQSLWPGILKVKDTPTGEVYVFPKAGAKLPVSVQDVEYLLGKNRNGTRGCCGSGNSRILFELA